MSSDAMRPVCPGFCRACGWDADLAESGDGYLDGVEVPEAPSDEAYEEWLEEEGHAAVTLHELEVAVGADHGPEHFRDDCIH